MKPNEKTDKQKWSFNLLYFLKFIVFFVWGLFLTVLRDYFWL